MSMGKDMTLSWRDIEHMAAVHLALIHVGLGTTIIAGGPLRFPPPTYDVLLGITGGRAWPYGMIFIITGIILTISHPKAIFIGHVVGIIAFNVFAALFFVAMLRSPTAAATAWWAYFALGTIHGFNLALMMVRRKRHLYPELEKEGGGEA